ncbi:hypothetical protein C8Q70DRAFT_103937 [Cubamyces menziesii]|nr:hypothetical protein C8Q70DRAFT_103937 [Cubamyces menziesii]
MGMARCRKVMRNVIKATEESRMSEGSGRAPRRTCCWKRCSSMYTARFGCVNRTEDLGMPCRPGPGESSRNFLRVHMCPSSVMDAQNWSDDAKRRCLAPKPTPSTAKEDRAYAHTVLVRIQLRVGEEIDHRAAPRPCPRLAYAPR